MAGQGDALHARVQTLPGGVVGPLVCQRLFDAAGFNLNLQLGIAVAFFLGARFDAECGQWVEVGRKDAQRSLHQLAIASPFLRVQPPVTGLLFVADA